MRTRLATLRASLAETGGIIAIGGLLLIAVFGLAYVNRLDTSRLLMQRRPIAGIVARVGPNACAGETDIKAMISWRPYKGDYHDTQCAQMQIYDNPPEQTLLRANFNPDNTGPLNKGDLVYLVVMNDQSKPYQRYLTAREYLVINALDPGRPFNRRFRDMAGIIAGLLLFALGFWLRWPRKANPETPQ